MPESHPIEPRKPRGGRDFDFFLAGLERRQLLVQECGGCGRKRHPPGPMCPSCHALHWSPVPLVPKGRIHSYTIHHHPPLPDYETPHPIVLVDMEGGLRVLGPLTVCNIADVAIGLPVDVEFFTTSEGFSYYRFRLSPQAGQ